MRCRCRRLLRRLDCHALARGDEPLARHHLLDRALLEVLRWKRRSRFVRMPTRRPPLHDGNAGDASPPPSA